MGRSLRQSQVASTWAQLLLFLPTLFNVFLEWIMTDTLENQENTISIGGGTITSLCFAGHQWLSRRGKELLKLVGHLDKASTTYAMDISAEKTKLMTNNTCGINIASTRLSYN